MNTNKNAILLLFLTFLFGCRKDAAYTCTDDTALHTFSDYPIGAAIDPVELANDPFYRSVAVKQFNSITPENIFKADQLHPASMFFNWVEGDSLVSFAARHHKRVHGHTLIWHQQLPQWILDYSGSTADWEALMKTHIQTIVRHYKDQVKAWDVVNEAFNEDGTLRNSIWKQKIGSGYIEKAFQYAREADPDALLFYNEYNLESNPTKRNSVLALLNTLRNRGVKVDGIGLQLHVGLYYPESSEIGNAFRDIAAHQYKIHLSELDISVNRQGEDLVPGETLFNKQANLLGRIVLHYNQLPSQYRYGITFWGISDKNSWLRSYYNREDYPLLYDDHFKPKPCYCKLLETL